MNADSYYSRFCFAFLILIPCHLFPQAEKTPKTLNTSSSKSSDDSHSIITQQNLPNLKYESGDITIDLKLETERLKKQFDREFAENKVHMKNVSNIDLINKLNESRINSENLYINAEFTNARRSYKVGLDILKQFYKEQSEVYKSKFKDYTQIFNSSKDRLVESKTENKAYRLESLSKKQKESMLYNFLAKNHEDANRFKHSYNMYKLANKEILEAILMIKQELGLEANTQKENTEKIYIIEDYLSPVARKDWDDILGIDHIMEENKRALERNRIQEFKSKKHNSDNKQASPNDESEPKNQDVLQNKQQQQ